MTRGGARRRTTAEPERRCIATGESGSTDRLIRFVAGPDGRAVPDLAGRLPGRGAWVTADRAAIDRAERKRLFARAFRGPVSAPEGLADLVERLLVERLVGTVSLARKAGQAVTGFEKTRARLAEGRAGVLLAASDGAADGRGRLARAAGALPRIEVLDARELGLAFGRDFAIHAALDTGGFADRALFEARRLAGFRPGAAHAPGGGAADDGSVGQPGEGGQDGPGCGPGQDCS